MMLIMMIVSTRLAFWRKDGRTFDRRIAAVNLDAGCQGASDAGEHDWSAADQRLIRTDDPVGGEPRGKGRGVG